MIKISVISTGSELLSEKSNVNLHHITKKIFSIGLKIDYNITIPDDKQILKQVLKFCVETTDIIIITGGLGPTVDDITLSSVAEFVSKNTTLNKEVYHNIVEYFSEKGIEMPKLSERQAYVIDGAEIFFNRYGHAPGEKIVFNNRIIYLLPGPVRECIPMFDEYVFTQIKKYQTGVTKECVLHICGVPESKVEEIIKPVIESEKYSADITFAILPHMNIVDLKIIVNGQNELVVDEELLLVKKEVYDCFKTNSFEGELSIYGENNETLEYVIGMLLGKNKKTISIAESCTSGMIQERINRVAGSSLYFLGGVVVYSDNLKVKVLNVRKDILKTYGSVSEEVVKEMCLGLKSLTAADYCVSISGIAGPGGATVEKPVGTVWVCVYDGEEFLTQKLFLKGTRQEIKEQSTNFVLDFVRRKIVKDLKQKKH